LKINGLSGVKWFDARPHPGPLPQGEGETLPVLWQNVALLIQEHRGKSSGGKVNSTENSEEPKVDFLFLRGSKRNRGGAKK
jgi:hypothetical protein